MHMSSVEYTMQFCRDIGIKTIHDSNDPINMAKVVMKAGPISIIKKESITRIQNPGRSEDSFVFGELYHQVIQHQLHNSTTSLNGASISHIDSSEPLDRNDEVFAESSDDDDWETKYENKQVLLHNNGDTDVASIHAQMMGRFDSDNILIPPSWLLWALLR